MRPGRPPLEELWHYLHEPAARGAGLSARFVAMLRRALSHYDVSLDAPGRALEVALLRLQKAHERAADQLGPVTGILERRLAAGGTPQGFAAADRELLGQLAELGQELSPALADLAREVQYRRFDQPALEEARATAYAQAESDLARLGAVRGEELERIVERLVACPHPLPAVLLSRTGAPPPAPGSPL